MVNKLIIAVIIGAVWSYYKWEDDNQKNISNLAFGTVVSGIAMVVIERLTGINVNRMTKELSMIKKGKAPF